MFDSLHRIASRAHTVRAIRFGCCALAVALIPGAAPGVEPSDVRVAFLGQEAEEEMSPPSHPMPPGTTDSMPQGAYSADGQMMNSYGPAMNTHSIAGMGGYNGDYGYGGGCDNGYCAQCNGGHCHACNGCSHSRCDSWPVIGGIHRRYVNHWKPHLQASHWGYPEYFEERPFGSYTLQAEQMQIVNGLRDQQVLYHYDFGTGDRAGELTPRGEYQLRKIVQRMQMVPAPIVIQTSVTDPKLDQARKQAVYEALQAAGVPATPDMVVVNHPPLPGLQGLEATFIYGNMLRQTQERGGGFDFENGGGFGAPVNIGNVSFGNTGQ